MVFTSHIGLCFAQSNYQIYGSKRSFIIRSIFTRESQPGLRLCFLILLSLLCIFGDKKSDTFAQVKAALSLPLAPIQYLISLPAKSYEKIKDIVVTHDQLRKENLELKTKQLILNAKLQRFLSIESENNYLKSLLQSTRTIKGKTLIAELLAVVSEPFINQVIVDKGTKDGVYDGQPVLDAKGLMGQVIQVGPITSRILLINDPHSGVSVQNTRNGVRAIATGDTYSGKLRLIHVPKTADILVGDVFTTSGLGDRYPEGYPVGEVISVIKDPGQQFAAIVLQPTAHLDSSRQVLLIWYERNA